MSVTRELNVDGITVRFGGLVAIHDVTMSIRTGEVLGLIGPNGAGKTTFVNCLTGFQKLSEGTIRLDKEDIRDWDEAYCRRRGIARTFQAGRMFSDMTVLENVEVAGVGLGMSRPAARKEARRLLDWVGIGADANLPAGILPYTDERRAGIARALVCRPAFVLLDEPAAGMSEHECEDLMRIVREMPVRFNCGVLLIEHNMSVVMDVCDQVHVLDGGRTLAAGTPAAVAADPAVITAYLGEEA